MNALKLGRIWATAPASPNIDPGAEKWKLGWVSEIPVFQMLNYINNRYDTNIVALAERGTFEWGTDLTYNIGALVWDETDGSIYISKVAEPSKTTRPSLNATQWDKSSVQISRAQYDLAVAGWNNHIANTSNPHQLTTEILNTYAKSVIDGKVATVQGGLNSHVTNVLNPHKVSAVQAGAVPVTGGNYTGLVRHLFASTGIGASTYAATLLTDATGTFLTLGTNSKIGLDNSNKAVFIDGAAVKSNLLIESEYIAARELIEAAYVPPTPDCEVVLRNSLNMSYGNGVVVFTGPAGSRGYWDKSSVAQTAPLNGPRFTEMGLYTSSFFDKETLTIPTALNIYGASSYTWMADARSIPDTQVFCAMSQGATYSSLEFRGGNYVYKSADVISSGVYSIAPVDHSKSHKFVVVSDATQNKTFVYFDGELKVTIPAKQNVVTANEISISASKENWGPKYFNSFKTWLSALTPQQVSNL